MNVNELIFKPLKWEVFTNTKNSYKCKIILNNDDVIYFGIAKKLNYNYWECYCKSKFDNSFWSFKTFNNLINKEVNNGFEITKIDSLERAKEIVQMHFEQLMKIYIHNFYLSIKEHVA